MDAITAACALLVLLNGAVHYATSSALLASAVSLDYRTLQWRWMVVYICVMGSDWLQGPYVYALYESYGYGEAQIGSFFAIEFGASLVIGTLVTSVADSRGRKRMTVLCGALLGAGALCETIDTWAVLVLGRVTAGVATMLMHSTPEAWLVHEHSKNGYPEEYLSHTFAIATVANGFVATLAGVLASCTASSSSGLKAPFYAAAACGFMGALSAFANWEENYGDDGAPLREGLVVAISSLAKDSDIIMVGMVESLFEASMNIFVFMWSPVLARSRLLDAPGAADDHVSLPYGIIFSSFMLCVMLGSAVFDVLTRRGLAAQSTAQFARVMGLVLLVAAACFVVAACTESFWVQLVAFYIFEVCCGAYFPCISVLRSMVVPEDCRASIMAFFRVPLNVLTIVVLQYVGDPSSTFLLCASWLLISLFFCLDLGMRRTGTKEKAEHTVLPT